MNENRNVCLCVCVCVNLDVICLFQRPPNMPLLIFLLKTLNQTRVLSFSLNLYTSYDSCPYAPTQHNYRITSTHSPQAHILCMHSHTHTQSVNLICHCQINPDLNLPLWHKCVRRESTMISAGLNGQ